METWIPIGICRPNSPNPIHVKARTQTCWPVSSVPLHCGSFSSPSTAGSNVPRPAMHAYFLFGVALVVRSTPEFSRDSCSSHSCCLRQKGCACLETFENQVGQTYTHTQKKMNLKKTHTHNTRAQHMPVVSFYASCSRQDLVYCVDALGGCTAEASLGKGVLRWGATVSC